MKLNIKDNIHFREVELDQKTSRYMMCCSIFAPHINLAYNTWKQVDYDDIERWVQTALANETLDLLKWWRYTDNQEIVAKQHLNSSISFWKDEKYFDILLDKWYAVQCYFYANRAFVDTIRDDWIIQIDNYQDYVWRTYAHTWNIIKRWDKYYALDSVFVHVDNKDIEITDIKEFRQFLWKTCYAFI